MFKFSENHKPKMRFLKICFLSLFISLNLFSKQENINFYNSSNIIQMLDKLDVFGKVLYIAAHPDDENTRLITYLANEKKYETAYLSMTRGGGGQNFIGTHLKENLGLIRTQELLKARELDGGIQFFTSAVDFGYSKGPVESLDFWDEEKMLHDFVWIIRKFRPDILITRFNQTPGITHGHHTASAILAQKAFNMSGDPDVFPDQLEHVKPWKPQRIFWNTSSRFFNLDKYDKDKMLKVDVGIYNNLLGKSYNEIASESRSMHKSQAFGALRRRGSEIELFVHTQGKMAKDDMMEGIDTSWERVRPHDRLKELIKQSKDSFDIRKPHLITSHLADIYRELNRITDRHWREIKKKEIKNLIKVSTGLFFESLSDIEIAAPGDNIKINFEAINRSPVDIKLKKIVLLDKEILINHSLINNQFFRKEIPFTVPDDSKISEKYWLVNKPSFGRYSIDDLKDLGAPDNSSGFTSKFYFEIEGQEVVYSSPLQNKTNNPTKGDDYKNFSVGNPIYINPKNELELFVNSNKKDIEIDVIAGKDNYTANISLDVPEGVKYSPEFHAVSFDKNGEKKTFKFEIDLSGAKETNYDIKYKATDNKNSYYRGIDVINYDHIPLQTRFPESSVSIKKFNLDFKSKKIAYLMGPGDLVPQSLGLVGYQVDLLKSEQINLETLREYDALIFGVRAFNVDKSLTQLKPQIMSYIENGGNVILQYNTSSRWNNLDLNSFLPHNLNISRNRVSEENAPVTILNPKHPALNIPNKITLKDFDGWVQERGLYFPNEWSENYETLITSNDKGEEPNDGGILISKIGRGHFIYTSYSWFRQLPAGVPGAYKLFSNLLSLGKK